RPLATRHLGLGLALRVLDAPLEFLASPPRGVTACVHGAARDVDLFGDLVPEIVEGAGDAVLEVSDRVLDGVAEALGAGADFATRLDTGPGGEEERDPGPKDGAPEEGRHAATTFFDDDIG